MGVIEVRGRDYQLNYKCGLVNWKKKKKDFFFKTYTVHSTEQNSKIDIGLGYFRHLFDKAILKFYLLL